MLWANWLEGSSFVIWFLTIFRNLHVDSAEGWRNFSRNFSLSWLVTDGLGSFHFLWLVTVGLGPLCFRRLFVCRGFFSFRIVDNQNWVIRWLILCIVCLCCYYVDRDQKLVFYCVNFNTLSISLFNLVSFWGYGCTNVFDCNVMFSLINNFIG